LIAKGRLIAKGTLNRNQKSKIKNHK